MNKNLNLSFFLLFILLYCNNLQGVNPIIVNSLREISCEAPPPDYLHVGLITPTSVYLDWGYYSPPGGTPIFQVEMYDVTSQTSLPSYITPSLAFVYQGLTPGHYYIATISASYCPEGDYGTGITAEFNTPQIIIDDLVQNSCIPSEEMMDGTAGSFGIFPLTPENSSGAQVMRFKVMKVVNNQIIAYTVFTLWADCNQRLQFWQYGHSGLDRTPDYTMDGIASSINYTLKLPNSNNKALFEIVKPFYDPDNNLLIARFHYSSDVKLQFCSENTGTCYCCASASPLPLSSIYRENPHLSLDPIADRSLAPSPTPLSVTPNPFTASLQANYFLDEPGKVSLQLFSAAGQMMRTWESEAEMDAGEHVTVLNTADLAPGMYFLRFHTSKGIQTRTLVKTE